MSSMIESLVKNRIFADEEDDWLDCKVAKEMLESWTGLREGSVH